MEMVKFVKVTEENKDEIACELGWESEGDLLKDADFETLVGLWVDTDDDVEVDNPVNIHFARVSVVHIDNRRFGDNWYSAVYTEEADLLMIGQKVGVMDENRYIQLFS